MQSSKVAWKEAAWVFLLSRLLIVLMSAVSVFVLPQFVPFFKAYLVLAPHYSEAPDGLSVFFFSWLRWDAVHYVNISFQGYKDTQDVAFFPLWPVIQHFFGLLLGGSVPGSYYLAGLLFSNLCFYFVLVLLYFLLTEDFDPAIARRALYYLAFAPYALFFFAGYTESLFVLLCLAIFLLLRRGKWLDWWLAGLLGFLAVLTRSSGMLLIVPYLVMYVQRFWSPSERPKHGWGQKFNAVVPIVLFPTGILVYMLYLYYTKGNPLIFSIEEEAIWYRHFSLPWDTIILVVRAIFASPNIFYLAGNLLFFTITLISLVVLILGWKRLPLHYSLFALTLAVFVVSFPAYTIEPLLSQPRYMLVIFPITVILAMWGKSPRFHQLFLALCLPLLMLNIVLFIGNLWVA